MARTPALVRKLKLIAPLSIVFLLGALVTANAWSDNSKRSVIPGGWWSGPLIAIVALAAAIFVGCQEERPSKPKASTAPTTAPQPSPRPADLAEVARPPAPEPTTAKESETNKGGLLDDEGVLNFRVGLGTDIASFFIYHPDDLAYRQRAPESWWFDDFAARKALAEGQMLAFVTRSDGYFSFRITNAGLTERERKYAGAACDFRMVVKHGRLFLDNGDSLPYEEQGRQPEYEDELWFELPNGNYRVTVHSINWHKEPGAVDEDGSSTDKALTSYVMHFEPVADAASVEPPPGWPDLVMDQSYEPKPMTSEDENLRDRSWPLEENYPVLVAPGLTLVPWGYTDVPVSEASFKPLTDSLNSGEVVIVPSDELPATGVLSWFMGPSGRNDAGPWVRYQLRRLVIVTAVAKGEVLDQATVKPFVRPASTVAPDDIAALKRGFAEYARANTEFRKKRTTADYQVERIESMSTATGITNLLLTLVVMDDATRLDITMLSDADRVPRLLALMAQ